MTGAGALLAAGARHVQGARDILQGRQACSAAPTLHAPRRQWESVLAGLQVGCPVEYHNLASMAVDLCCTIHITHRRQAPKHDFAESQSAV